MIQSFWVPGPLPGLNEIVAAAKIGGRGRVYSQLKARCDSVVILSARAAKLIPVPWAAFTFQWIEPNRRRDPDNVAAGAKFILDGLVAAFVIPGDGPRHVRGLYHRPLEVAGEPGVGCDDPGVFVTMESP